MKSTVPAIVLSIFCAFATIPKPAHAQGNDFPFSPNVPSWNQPSGQPGITPGYDYGYGTAWGAVQLPARRGDTVVIDFVLDWWGLGPLSTSIRSDQIQNLRWMGPDTRAGQWNHDPLGFWCLRCEWRFEAGDDYPWLWVDYTGSEQFGMHLEIKEIIPGSTRQPLLDQYTKEQNQRYANVTILYAGIFTAGGMAAHYLNPGLTPILSGAAFLAGLLNSHFQAIANDPFDDQYGYPYDAVLDQQLAESLDWICPTVSDAEPWVDGIKYLTWACPQWMEASLHAEAYTKAIGISLDRAQSCIDVGAGCEDWQRARAVEFFHLGSYWLGQLAGFHSAIADGIAWHINRTPGEYWDDGLAEIWSYLKSSSDVYYEASWVYGGVQ